MTRSEIMTKAWEIYRHLKKGTHRSKLSYALSKAWEESRALKAVKGTNVELVELKGSPKQIAWANTVRAKVIARLLPYMRGNAFFAKINAITSAAWWIDWQGHIESNGERDVVELIVKEAKKCA